MKIDFNENECKAMEAFLRNDFDLAVSLQAGFLSELKQSMRNGEDHCPCPADCSIHGKCVICVQIHRGHGNHLPHCMQLMLNKKLASLSELSEHSIVKNVEIPDYLNWNSICTTTAVSTPNSAKLDEMSCGVPDGILEGLVGDQVIPERGIAPLTRKPGSLTCGVQSCEQELTIPDRGEFHEGSGLRRNAEANNGLP